MNEESYGSEFDIWIKCTEFLLEAGLSVEVLQEGIREVKDTMKCHS